MAITFKQAAGIAVWRTFCLVNVLATYYAVHYAIVNLRQSDIDPMARVIGWTTLSIWVMAEITIAGYMVLWIEWRKNRAQAQR